MISVGRSRGWHDVIGKKWFERPLTISIVSIRNSVKEDREEWAFTGGHCAQNKFFACIGAPVTNRRDLTSQIHTGAHGPAGIWAGSNDVSKQLFSMTLNRKANAVLPRYHSPLPPDVAPQEDPTGTKQHRPHQFYFPWIFRVVGVSGLVGLNRSPFSPRDYLGARR